jgi:Protein of unknown function (DUF3800)
MGLSIYLDESGDLGREFELPFGRGGSSRFFTLAAVAVDDAQISQLTRTVRGIYKGRSRLVKSELKSHQLNQKEKALFAQQAKQMAQTKKLTELSAITVDKRSLPALMHTDREVMLHHMHKQLLLPLLISHAEVTLIPDQTNGGERLTQTLDAVLNLAIAEAGANTQLTIRATDSKHDLAVQFADYLAGLAWQASEFGKDAGLKMLGADIRLIAPLS